MNLLFVSNLFPNGQEPTRGTFNLQQVLALAKFCTVTKVIAPTPKTLPDEQHQGVRIVHPRFRSIPLLTRPLNSWLYARCIEDEFRSSQFDVAFASFAYPDGHGVSLLAKKYGFHFAVDVLGSDVNILFHNPHRRSQILTALRGASAVFAKSKALQARLAELGVSSHIDYNGVDREKFRPRDRGEACRALCLDPQRRRILYVGNLQPVKGPTVLANAFSAISAQQSVVSGTDLVFIGDGPERSKVEQICRQQSAVSYQVPEVRSQKSEVYSPTSKVFLMGARPHHEVPLWINACDVLCLPSFNEGLPNVCIEAAACGLPVVASNVGGVPEVVQEGINGFLVPSGNPTALADALCRALSHPWDRTVIVQSVAAFNWDANARQVVSVLESIVHSPTS